MTYSAEEKLREIRREIEMRKYVYGRTSTISPHEAKFRIDIMEEIAEDYRKLAEAEEPRLL
jgi:hypothetical protein